MASLLKWPMQIMSDGSFRTANDYSEDYVAQEIGIVAQTVAGERHLVPNFGIGDPTFQGFDIDELEANLAAFLVPARIIGYTDYGVEPTNSLHLKIDFVLTGSDYFNRDIPTVVEEIEGVY